MHTKKMKILILCRGLSGQGGMETMIRTLLLGLNTIPSFEANLVILNFTKRPPKSNLWKNGLPIQELYSRAPRFLMRYSHALNLSHYLKQHNIDKIICADEYCTFIANLARIITNKKYLIFSWIHFSLHTIKPYRKKWITKSDANIAISSQIATQIAELGFNKKRIFTLFNCVSQKKFTLAENRKSSNKDITKNLTFIYIGRVTFEGQKRLKDMFLGLSGLPFPWRLHIIGSGEDTEILKEFSKKLKINNNIFWHGWQTSPWEYIKSNIGDISCFLLTSAFEGMPMSLIEAVSYGIPCIASDCQTGPSDIISNGKNGYLYENLNVDSLIKQINKFYNSGIDLSPNEIQTLAKGFYEEYYFSKLKEILNLSL